MNRGRILITGGAGFIGSHLVQRLYSEGHSTVVLDNLSPQIHGKVGKSATFSAIEGKCEFIKGDVQNRDDWHRALQGVEQVIHLAAETGTGQSMYECERYTSANCGATAILADLLSGSEHSVNSVIVASSRAVYGEGKYECAEHGIVYPHGRVTTAMNMGQFECTCPFCSKPAKALPTDELSTISPLSVYGLTKYFQENIMKTVCASLNITYTALRFQNVYGPGQSLVNPYTGILSIFSNRLKENKDVFIFEDGNESRDFVFITDVVESLYLSTQLKDCKSRVLNVGTGVMTTVMEVAQTLKQTIGSSSTISVTGQFRKGDIRHNYADLTFSKQELGFIPKVMFAEGVEAFINWAKNNEGTAEGYEKSLLELEAKGILGKKC